MILDDYSGYSGGGASKILAVRKHGLGRGQCVRGWPLPRRGFGIALPESLKNC